VLHVSNDCFNSNNIPVYPFSTSSFGTLSCPSCGMVMSASDSSPPAATRGRIVLQATFPQPIATALLLVGMLSPRERTTFELLGLGYDNRSIARELQISERTTKRHVTAILKKLKLESRLQAGLTALILFSCLPGMEPVVQKSYGRSPGPG
jgi:DNA-binding CsgD family transcriptional regulator